VAGIATRRPDHHRHPSPQAPYGDQSGLSIVLSIVVKRQDGSKKNLAGIGEIQTPLRQGAIAFRWVESDPHD
jgi:hypothetical protein